MSGNKVANAFTTIINNKGEAKRKIEEKIDKSKMAIELWRLVVLN